MHCLVSKSLIHDSGTFFFARNDREICIIQYSFLDIAFAEQAPWELHYDISHCVVNASSTCVNVPGLVCLDQTFLDPEDLVKMKLPRQNVYHAPLGAGESKEKWPLCLHVVHQV